MRFVVPGLIPLRTLTLLAGVGGLGKSTWAAGVAARETKGEHDSGSPHGVLVISYEDTAEDVWRPRVLAANGDPDRVIEVRVDLDDGGVVSLPDDLEPLELAIRDHDVRLVVVDPIVAAIDLKFDSHKDQHVRQVLGQLTRLAETTDSAVLGIGHLNKSPSADAYIRVANSAAFWNASRSVVLVTKEDDEHRLVSQVKANWARSSAVQRHRIDSIELPDERDEETGCPIVTSRTTYVGDVQEIDADDVLRAGADDREAGELLTAVVFLAHELADANWYASARLKSRAAEKQISERTLRRAAKRLEVEYDRRGFPSTTYWRLPSRAGFTPGTLGPTVQPASLSGIQSVAWPVGPAVSGAGATNGRDGLTDHERAVIAALDEHFPGAEWLT